MANYLDYAGLEFYTELINAHLNSEISTAASTLSEQIQQGLAEFSSALKFRDFLSGSTAVNLTSAHTAAKQAEVLIVNDADKNVTFRNSEGVSTTELLEIGDMLICLAAKTGDTADKAPKWGVLQTNLKVQLPQVDGSVVVPELSDTSDVTLATVAGIPIKVKLSKALGNAASKGVVTTINGETQTDDNVPTEKAVANYVAGEMDGLVNTTSLSASDSDKGVAVSLGGTLASPSIDVAVTPSTLKTNLSLSKSDVGLGNVGNFKAVSTAASQGLTAAEKSNARENIGLNGAALKGVSTSIGSSVSDDNVPTEKAVKTYVDSNFVAKNGTKGLSTNDYTDAAKAKVDALQDAAFVDYTGDGDFSSYNNNEVARATDVVTYVSAGYVAKESGKGLSTNDYTTTEKNKLSGIATGATKDGAMPLTGNNSVQAAFNAGTSANQEPD